MLIGCCSHGRIAESSVAPTRHADVNRVAKGTARNLDFNKDGQPTVISIARRTGEFFQLDGTSIAGSSAAAGEDVVPTAVGRTIYDVRRKRFTGLITPHARPSFDASY